MADMTSAARKFPTYEDLLALPEDVRAEILGGAIEVQASASPEHGIVAGELHTRLNSRFGGRGGGWWFIEDTDVRLSSGEVVRPDISGWRREHLPRPKEQPIAVVPDWICEVVSPGPKNRRRDHVTKRASYAVNGVPYYWLLDPSDRTLLALMLQDGRWLEIGTYDDTAIVRIAPFEELELDVGSLFLPADEADAETPSQ